MGQLLNTPEDLVMEYVTGGDLFDYINRNGRIRMFRPSRLAVAVLSRPCQMNIWQRL